MRIAVSGLRGFPDVMGGIETHCQNLYPHLIRVDPSFEVTAFGRTPYVGDSPYEYSGVHVRPIWTVRQKLFETILHTFLSVLRARFDEKADVLHLHAIGPGLMIPLARLLGLRVVATHHGQDYRRMKWGPVARLSLRIGEAVMVRFATETICVSRSAAIALRARWPSRADRIRFIPNGADMPAPGPEDAKVLEGLGLRPGDYVLAVGRLVPEKGFQDLIAAHERAPKAPPLVIVGDADHSDDFSAGLRARASERVRFAGRRRPSELTALYRGAALFVLPSYHEGHPIVALEALLCGAPVLLSDIEANLDVGLPSENHFPIGDVDALARALDRPSHENLRVLDGPLIDSFDWARIAVETASVLRRAAA